MRLLLHTVPLRAAPTNSWHFAAHSWCSGAGAKTVHLMSQYSCHLNQTLCQSRRYTSQDWWLVHA